MLKPIPLSHVSQNGLRELCDLSKRHEHEAPALFEWLADATYAERHRRCVRPLGREESPRVLRCPTQEWPDWSNADIAQALQHLTAASYTVDDMTARDLLDRLVLWVVALASNCLNQEPVTCQL